MMKFLGKAALALAVVCAPLMAQTQVSSLTPSIEYGRTTLQFDPNFLAMLPSLGATIADLNNNPLQNGSITFRATGGSIDVTTAEGEVQHTGGFLINAAGTVLRIQNLTLDTSNLAALVVTAEIIANDHYAGRIALFNLAPPPGLTVPLQPQSGVVDVKGFTISLTQAASSAIFGIFGQTIPAGTLMGTQETYVVLARTN